jgi:hypothetical protein
MKYQDHKFANKRRAARARHFLSDTTDADAECRWAAIDPTCDYAVAEALTALMHFCRVHGKFTFTHISLLASHAYEEQLAAECAEQRTVTFVERLPPTNPDARWPTPRLRGADGYDWSHFGHDTVPRTCAICGYSVFHGWHNENTGEDVCREHTILPPNP